MQQDDGVGGFLMLVGAYLAGAFFFEWPPFTPKLTYEPEVSYYRGSQEAFHRGGEFKSLDDCRTALNAMTAAIAWQSPTRVIASYCREMKNGVYMTRK